MNSWQATDNPLKRPPENYWDPGILERERRNDFATNWIFAGFAQDLAKPNDYIAFTVAGVPVTVHNMKGQLVAFKNVCSHRHSLIHPTGCGNDRFRCSFHGWTYDANGVPIGIPHNAKSFGLDEQGKKDLALKPYVVDTCGNLVFVREAREGASLKEWLGPFAAPLEQASTVFSDIYTRFDVPWACNWKVPMETVLTYRDYPAAEGMASPGIATGESRIEKHGAHMAIYAPLPAGTKRHLSSCARNLKSPRASLLSGYDRFFIYPNLVISTDYGVNSLISRYEPTASEQTHADFWMLTGRPGRSRIYGGPVWKAVTEHWEQFGRAVLEDFRILCETLHVKTQSGSPGEVDSEEFDDWRRVSVG